MNSVERNHHRPSPIRGLLATVVALPALVVGFGQLAAEPYEVVGIRTGVHETVERIVFQWPDEVGYEVTGQGAQVIIEFDRPGRFDVSHVSENLGRLVLDAHREGNDFSRRIILDVRPDVSFTSFDLDGNVVVVDVLEPRLPAAKPGRSAIEEVPGTNEAAATHPLEEATIAAADVASPDADRIESETSLRDASDAPVVTRQAVPPVPVAKPKQGPSDAVRHQLQQRDVVIAGLLQRIERLERRLALGSTDLDSIVAGGLGPAFAGGGSLGLGSRPETTPAVEPAVAQNEAPAADSQPVDQAAPGQFEVDEEAADRALERTLVQAGALLLPFGQYEMQPHFSYTRSERDTPILFFGGEPTFVAEGKVRRNEFEAGQTVRIGLPFDSQVEFDFPYRYVDQSTITTVNGARVEDDGSGSGMGDTSVGFAKTLLREGSWWPDLVGRIRWNSDFGETEDNDIALGGGFNEISGSFSVTKRQDPLAFVGGLSYATTFEKNGVEPGDQIGVSFGTLLAASPETSLRLSLAQSFINETKFDGRTIDGSDRVSSSLTIGASSILGRGVLLDAAVDVGLTDDAPDYAARISVPVRFNVPTGF